jgi:hypothetical protein
LLAQALAQAWLLLEEYEGKASPEGLADFSEAVQSAEAFFVAQTATTSAQVTAAINALKDARFALMRSTGEAVDYTSYLTNNSFELKTTSGWTADNVLYPSVRAITELSFFTAGYDGGYLLYVMGKDSIGTNIYQTVSNLPNGTYRVKGLLATDIGYTVQLFANGQSVNVPASRFGSSYFNEGSVETVVTDGKIKLGARSNDRWYKADNFRLYYLGSDTILRVRNVKQEADAVEVLGGKGSISVQCEVETRIRVCNLFGITIRQAVVQSGLTRLEGFAPGIYIVNRRKVIVL